MIRHLALAALAGCVALPMQAQDLPLITTTYQCDRGVTVPASYFDFGDYMYVVINVEGRQITLIREVAASGARYGWPSDGASYVWWGKGSAASLYWKQGSEETPLLTCVEQM
ncbi:MAG: MliC family protein [Paracoccaceae bacterium]